MYNLYWKLAVAAWFLVSTVASPDPSVGPVDSSATPADLSTAPADPTTAPADPSAPPADPSATPTDTDQKITAIVRSMQYLLGEVIGHQQNAETFGKGIYVLLEDIASRQQGVEIQLEDIASRQQGVDSKLEDIASRQQGMESQQEDIASRQQGVESQLEDIISRLEGVETRQNHTTEKLASIAAETRMLVAPRDCSDLPPGSPSGVYQMTLTSAVGPATDAFCNQTIAEGGWTVFQRRADIQPRQNFYLTWVNYKFGFGNMDGGEFWWGLEKLRRLISSSDRIFQLRIDLEDEDGNWGYAVYDNFRISSEADGYRLHISNYTGDVGDSFTHDVGNKFTTKDRDQDKASYNCAQDRKGAWWYSGVCGYVNLNGRYKPGTSSVTAVWWHKWRSLKCLKTVEMKLRPA